MSDALFIHRIHFAFTISFHYLFPQLTMGLAPLIVALKTLGLRTGRPVYGQAARFWTKIFGISFAAGVVTGIPMEFQFGTNWARFSQLTGGVIAQPVAMEGVFSFFLESAFLGMFLYGEKRLGRVAHWWTAFLVFAGSWLSGFFIVAADGWMQHPVAYRRLADRSFEVTSFWGVLLNPWTLIEYVHTMSGAVITGAFVMAAVGAFYLLNNQHGEYGRLFLRTGVTAGLIASMFQIFPSGDAHGKYMATHQPATTAGMEALFHSEAGAPMVILGQPDVERRRIDNPLVVNKALSFLIYGTTRAEVQGLDHFPQRDWPTNIPLLYFSYHVMAGLGTVFVALMGLSGLLLWRGALYGARWLLWMLMLSAPFPFIANTAGWMTAEVGRQPWLVYGLLRTEDGFSANVSAANGLFTLLGYMGLYALLSLFLLFLFAREIDHGPESEGRVMESLWFVLVAFMLVAYVVLDGFDLGAGALHLIAARTEEERRQVIASVGPVWDGNEVWLVAAGGTLFFAFPLLYAASFSGFYLGLNIVVWLLLFRAIGIEFRMHLENAVWRAFFDGAFSLASILLIVFFGAALGNVLRGVPLGADHYFFLPLWTDFRPSTRPGLLDWYTVLCAVTALAALAVHGALYVILKTGGELNARLRTMTRRLWPVLVALSGVALFATVLVRPALLDNYRAQPVGWIIPALVSAGLAGILYFTRTGREREAFLSSCLYIAASLAGAAFALYPVLLVSSGDAEYSLTIRNAAAGAISLSAGLVWWGLGMAVAVGYFVIVYRFAKGKVSV